MGGIMKTLISTTMVALFGLLSLNAQASSVTIDFEEFSLGTSSTSAFVSQGYEFWGSSFPGPIPDGLPSEIVTGSSGTNSLEAFNGWGGQDSYGANVSIRMNREDDGAFAIHSLDLLLAGCASGGVSCNGSESISGTLAGGGAADLSGAVGTGDWLNLVSVTFAATGDGFGYGSGTIAQIDNVNVSAVPVPAAVWLFGSALAGLGWMRRKQS